jgi:hypothetical protein
MVAGDIHRPQHPEFSDKLQTLMANSDWVDKIAKPELMRMLMEDKNTSKLQTVIMEDPLTELA